MERHRDKGGLEGSTGATKAKGEGGGAWAKCQEGKLALTEPITPDCHRAIHKPTSCHPSAVLCTNP